ncbi:MAG: transporter, partial [Acidobacteria bacterium]
APASAADSGASVAGAGEAVYGWARAWSQQNVGRYLGFYAAGFEPENGMDRASWRRLRQRRLTTPRSIEVTVSELTVEPRGAGRARARFVQQYRSDRYADRVVKRLELVWEEGWKILRERVEAQLAGP